MSEIPKHTFDLTLHISACDWDTLVRRMRDEVEHIADHGPECKSLWGGAGTCGHVEIVHRPEVTEESFRAELETWRLSRDITPIAADMDDANAQEFEQ